ncbi:MAG TPA: HD domain-containing phosphohydrolase, partial [Pirellulales bacterium]|nr:HD domain-containing phosphohydrolase [Pirellulales bacterium]
MSNFVLEPGLDHPTTAVTRQIKEGAKSAQRSSRILLVDDEPLNIKAARKYLSTAGYFDCDSTSNARDVVPMMIRNEPDLVLLDIVMPGFNGLDLLAAIRDDKQLAHIPIVMLTAVDDRQIKHKALELGATDFLSKPVDPSELISRVRNVLEAKAHHDYLRNHAIELERLVRERTAQLELSHQQIIHCLAKAAEFRDDETGRHVIRVGRYAGLIAKRLGWDDAACHMIEQAAQLHDVGKIGIPDEVLKKPGKLTPEEYQTIQKHCAFGKRVFESLTESDWTTFRRHAELGNRILTGCGSPVLDMAAEIALTHHERWDGSGYPIGLAGNDIPVAGRITAVADVFDALSTRRSYKPALPLTQCFEILEQGRAAQFDPQVLDAFVAARDDIVRI